MWLCLPTPLRSRCYHSPTFCHLADIPLGCIRATIRLQLPQRLIILSHEPSSRQFPPLPFPTTQPSLPRPRPSLLPLAHDLQAFTILPNSLANSTLKIVSDGSLLAISLRLSRNSLWRHPFPQRCLCQMCSPNTSHRLSLLPTWGQPTAVKSVKYWGV